MTAIFEERKIFDPVFRPWHMWNGWSIRINGASLSKQFHRDFVTRDPNMGFAHHGSLIDRSILVTPFFELEPAALHVYIVHTPDYGKTCILIFNDRIGNGQCSLPQGPGSIRVPFGRRGRLIHIQPVATKRPRVLTEKPCNANAKP